MPFADQFECEQAIGDALGAAMPESWRWVEVSAALDGEVIRTSVTYLKARGGQGSLGYVPNLARFFYELGRLVSSEEKGLFKTCVFRLESTGKFRVDFAYE